VYDWSCEYVTRRTGCVFSATVSRRENLVPESGVGLSRGPAVEWISTWNLARRVYHSYHAVVNVSYSEEWNGKVFENDLTVSTIEEY